MPVQSTVLETFSWFMNISYRCFTILASNRTSVKECLALLFNHRNCLQISNCWINYIDRTKVTFQTTCCFFLVLYAASNNVTPTGIVLTSLLNMYAVEDSIVWFSYFVKLLVRLTVPQCLYFIILYFKSFLIKLSTVTEIFYYKDDRLINIV